MSEPGDLKPESFIVRAFSIDSSQPYNDERYPDLKTAAEFAWTKAHEKTCRTVMVMDDFSMMWVQYNMLWQVDGEV